MDPLVSIGMSVFNCGPALIPTVRSLLDQTYGHWELILIDDGSTDNTSRLVREFRDPRIRVFSDGQNLKLPIRLNQAVSLSCGKYFARMDGGDIAYPERLEIQVRYLETHPEIDLVGSRIIIFRGNGRVVGTYPFRETHSDICRRPWAVFHLPHPTWMGKLDWFKAHPYRQDMRRTEDQELLLRTYQSSRFACVPNILLGYCKDFLSLRNILLGRLSYSRALIEKSIVDKRRVFVFGVFEHALKALIEIFSILSGLNYRILRRRALPVGQRDVSQWRQVWLSCTQAPGKEQTTSTAEKTSA